MIINFWVVLVCGVISMVVGSIWYGPIFGKVWMRIEGVNAASPEERKKMQKGMVLTYIIQFLLSLLQVYILAGMNRGLPSSLGIHNAILVWLGFVVPLVAGIAMWNNKSAGTKWARFWIQAGYYLIIFVIFAAIIAAWQ